MYPKVSTSVSKLGSSIATVNLPPETTCRKNAPCAAMCYAKRGNFGFKNVKSSLHKNYEAYLENPDRFFSVIDNTLNMIPYKYFRYHSSGDIPDETYLHNMCKLARKHKGTNFLCFTKQYEIVNEYLNKHRKPANLTLVLSNWGKWKCENPHGLPCSYVKFKNIENDIPDNAMHCSGYCGECVNQQHNCWGLKKGGGVYFDKH